MKEPLRTVFGLDLRALALLRVTLAVLILFNLAQLFPDASYFLSDNGAFSRQALLDTYNRPWALSFYMMAETPFQARLLLLLHAVFATGLLFGFHTRLCALASWILLISLQNRNPLILNGGDTVLAVVSFWILFLPVNARASLDALTRPEKDTTERPNLFADVPTAAYILQICLIYWMTVLFKSDTVWWNGQAVRIALESDQFVKSAGIALRSWSSLHPLLTWMTVLWELIGPVLLFIPWKNHWFRTAAIFGFTFFHASLFVTMELGLFPAACIVAWWALLPTPLFDALEKRLGRMRRAEVAPGVRLRDRLAVNGGTILSGRSWTGRVLASVALLYIFSWNLRSFDGDRFDVLLPDEANAVGHVFKLRQKWSMFSPAPPRVDGWFILRARLFNGDEIDLLNKGQPLRWEKPAVPVEQFPNRRWGKFFNNIRTSRYRDLRQDACDPLILRWNERVDVGFQITEAELYYMLERTLDDGVAEPEARRLWYRKNIKPNLFN